MVCTARLSTKLKETYMNIEDKSTEIKGNPQQIKDTRNQSTEAQRKYKEAQNSNEIKGIYEYRRNPHQIFGHKRTSTEKLWKSTKIGRNH